MPGYKWIINSRGYANVVSTTNQDEVYGLVYALEPSDEEDLDVNEGVPEVYTKEELEVDLWVGESKEPEKRKALVYIDRLRTESSSPRKEYILRMNFGIADAISKGVPTDYVENVLRRYIPEKEHLDDETEQLARKQAFRFEDEK